MPNGPFTFLIQILGTPSYRPPSRMEVNQSVGSVFAKFSNNRKRGSHLGGKIESAHPLFSAGWTKHARQRVLQANSENVPSPTGLVPNRVTPVRANYLYHATRSTEVPSVKADLHLRLICFYHNSIFGMVNKSKPVFICNHPKGF